MRQTTKSPSEKMIKDIKELDALIKQIRELSIIVETEINAAILACHAARKPS